MKKIYTFFVLFFIICHPLNTEAYVGLCCGKCGGNMPLNIMGGGIPETNEFRFKFSYMFMNMDGLLDGKNEINQDDLLGMPIDMMTGKSTGKYMAVPQQMDMSMYNLSLGYSFTDNQVSLTFGLNLPTGSISEKNSNHPVTSRMTEQLPYSMQLGSGTFDPKIGILYQGSSSPLWWGTNFIYTGRWYDNVRNYRMGDIYQLDLYTMYQVSYNLVTVFQVNGKKWTDISGEMDETAFGSSGRSTSGDPSSPYMTLLFNPENYGGTQLAITAGVQWQPYPLHIIELNAGIPVYQELNGPQPEERYRFMLIWYMELPTSSSIRYSGKKKSGKSRLGF